MQIPLPSLPEQHRIIAQIDELTTKIEEACRLQQQSVVEAEALFCSESSRFFLPGKNINNLKILAEVTTRITKGESPEWQGFSYQDFGPIFVRSENVLWGKLDLSIVSHIPVAFHQKLSRSQLKKGDVLINLVGASIGRTCVVSDTIGDANVNQAVAVISPNSEILNGNYLMYFLISSSTQDIIHGGKVETARPNISLDDLRKLIIPVPPISEQRRIVAYLDNLQSKVNALKHLQAETEAELDALLPSILDKAFKGEF